MYPSPEFQKLARSFVLVKINGEKGKGPGLMTRFNISGFPGIKFVNKDEQVIHEIGGYEPLDRFLADMRKALGQ